ncbi:MAG: LON peptidase substrate-binding domain-containing protein [Phycisphaerae bacterium]
MSADVKHWFDRPIAIFPLPNCVLLPRAIVPLHIFEPRYRDMVTDCLSSEAPFAIAVLQPGYEEHYYTHIAAIRETMCVGRIVRHEQLSDGRFNVLVQGVIRARAIREDRDKSYRRGRLQPIAPGGVPAGVAAEAARRTLKDRLSVGPLRRVAEQCQWMRIVECPDLPLTDVVDFLASAVSCNVDCAAKFLDEPDVARRLEMLERLMSEAQTRLAREDDEQNCRGWPRPCRDN